MKPLSVEEILDPDAYEEVRESFRRAIIEHKRRRRVPVGDRVTLVFEDRETLRFQVQEMCRVERIRDPALVQRELEVYNGLIPGPRELSATLFIEITDAQQIRPELDRLIGIDEHVALLLGAGTGATEIRARFDPKQLEEDRISAVQYIRFVLSPTQVALFGAPDTPVRLRIDHPHYRHETELAQATRASLLADLTGSGQPLLDADGGAARGREELLRETARLRILRPARPLVPGQLVIEAREPNLSLESADDAFLGELMNELRRAVREVGQRTGRCRIVAEVGPEPLRWSVLPRE